MNKKQKKFIASLVMFSLVVAMFSYIPMVNKANAVNSLKNASALVSDSDYGVAATSTFTVLTATSTANGGYFEVIYPAQYGTLTAANVTCEAGYDNTASAGRTAVCTRSGGTIAAATTTIIVHGVTNPASGNGYTININHYDIATNLIERVQVMEAMIHTIWMTARVDATLQFTVAGTSTGVMVNGITCTATTTATSTPFGTLVPDASSTVCQELRVTTNASRGFTVTVEQDQEMTSDGGDNINSFNNATTGTGSTTATAWANPSGILDNDDTYGHMGVTSNDVDLSSLSGSYQDLYYGAGTPHYVGLNGTAPRPVYHHDGPADGTTNGTQNKGRVMVAYTAQINALQQAGDYENTLTYIATPTY